jgi:hypothetical protein
MSMRGRARSAGAQVTHKQDHGMRGRARSAGAQITYKPNHGQAMPARPSSLGEVTQARRAAPSANAGVRSTKAVQ